MNILVITDVFPYPLSSGGAQGMFNIFNKLRQRHNITIFGILKRGVKDEDVEILKKKWSDVNIITIPYKEQLRDWHFFKSRIERAVKLKLFANKRWFKVERILKPYGIELSQNLQNSINKAINDTNPDIIEVNFYPCLGIIKMLPTNKPRVFLHHEIRYIRNNRILESLQLNKKEQAQAEMLKKEEIELLNKYDTVITVTDKDKEVLQNDGVTTKIAVSPSAVNAEEKDYTPWTGRLCYVGGYDHIPNKEGVEWFLENVYDNSIPLDIIGKGWPQQIQERYNNIIIHGFVENLAEAVKGHIMIIPLLTGSGMRMKILDAAAMSIPFITTTVGVEGLDFKNGESCLIADNAEQFKNAIEILKNDSALQEKLAKNAKAVYHDKYSPEKLAIIRKNIYKNTLAEVKL